MRTAIRSRHYQVIRPLSLSTELQSGICLGRGLVGRERQVVQHIAIAKAGSLHNHRNRGIQWLTRHR